MNSNFTALEKKIDVKFKNKELLKEALTHRSYLNENLTWPLPHNERLEFLGDAVLEIAITEALFEAYPKEQEGKLTSMRAALVNYLMLAKIARESVNLDSFLLLSRGETKDTGKARDVILANAMEAVIGAIHLDQGYEAAKKFIMQFIFSRVREVVENELYRDPKSSLQEIAQEKHKVTPHYEVLEEEGPDHQKEFSIGVFFGEKLIAKGKGSSKQEAERDAAEMALKKMK